MPTVKFPDIKTRNFRRLLIFFIIIIILAASSHFFRILTDWFWFQELGYQSVFIITLLAKIKMAIIFGLLFFIIFYGNLFLSIRLSSEVFIIEQGETIHIPSLKIETKSLQMLAIVAAVFLSISTAIKSSSQWENMLLFFHALPFGVSDPIFNKDAGFYIFKLPFFKYIYNWLNFTLIFTIITTLFIYFVRRAFQFIPPRTWYISPAARTHIFILMATLFISGSFGFWLDLNEIIFTKRGVIFGPGYTDVTTQLWVLKALIVISILCGASIIYYTFLKNRKVPAVAIAVFIILIVVGRGIYPSFVQKFKVLPNEIVMETPYLKYNIEYTRLAYGLNNIEDFDFPVDDTLTSRDIVKNEATIKNIRLWDYGPLLQTYSQLQEMRTYYKFVGVDNDRYKIDGEYRQLMLSARELSYPALPSKTWVNEHLIYTHGHGVVLGPVNRVSPEGLPEFFIKDIPPISSKEIKVTRPGIYYGETANEYVFVGTKAEEFDYPLGDKNVYTKYEGKGGVPLNFFRKLVFAVRFGSLSIMLSDDITSESRIMYYRTIKERVNNIVPFVRLDPDPYMVITQEGHLVWILDGYTITNSFPYSEPTPKVGNYIRNSIKAIVDAYDGTVELYISDPIDPIIQTYAKIFPEVFKPLSDMPEYLKGHIRYPPGMLAIQARMYKTYHMQEPHVFYNKEDMWAIPRKQGQGSEREIEPYYTIMKLPDETKEEFVLLLPFTPSKKDNMAAWMAARCDAPNYGKVIVYKFPKHKLVYGPRQIDARIDQDAEISKQLSLWNQRGSQVIRGSLLAIPIAKSILYVQPLYLSAERGQLPELKRVIVAHGNSVSMEENLELALQQIFGTKLQRQKEVAISPTSSKVLREQTDRELAVEALSHYRKAQEYLKTGNWSAYGDELKKMEETLRKIEKKK